MGVFTDLIGLVIPIYIPQWYSPNHGTIEWEEHSLTPSLHRRENRAKIKFKIQ